MNNFNYRDMPPEVARPMTAEQIVLMFCVFLRSDSAFAAVDGLVESAIFDDPEYYLFVAWRCYATVRKTAGPCPPKELILAQIQAEAAGSPDTVPGVVANSARWLIETAYSHPFGEQDSVGLLAWAKAQFQLFYANRKAVRSLQRTLSQAGGYHLIDPRQVLDRAKEELAKASVLSASEIYRVTTAPLPNLMRPIPTGVEPWDTATGGGVTQGKIYGLFGPTGSFKTGFAIQLMTGMAQSDYLRSQMDPTYKRGQLIYFAYECSADEIRVRMLSCAAEIPKRRVEECLGGYAQFTTEPNAHEYEAHISPELRPFSEVQRLARAEQVMAGVSIQRMESENGDSRGTGYVPELVGCVENVVRQTGAQVLAVFIDYAKLMARRYLWAGGTKFDQGRTILSQLPDLLRNEVASRYKTAVVLLQQLDHEANRMQACRPLHHSMSSEAKDLGENMWYCLCLSKIDQLKRGITILNASKTRDTAGLANAAALRLDPNISKLVPSEEYTVTPSGELVERSMLSRVVTPGEIGLEGLDFNAI